MQTKAPAPATGAEKAAGTPAQRTVSSVPGMGAHPDPARPQAMKLQRLQTSTSNSARVKQLGGMRGTPPPIQRREAAQPSATPQGKGLPPHLKHGIENLSGISMDGVTVHYNSPQPAQLRAHAFAQGSDIHLGPDQEAHLPHEAWHVVQQAQGRVAATTQMAGAALNDDGGLEHEADVMGTRAMAMPSAVDGASALSAGKPAWKKPVLQRKAGMEIELDVPLYGDSKATGATFVNKNGEVPSFAKNREIANFLFGAIERGPKKLSEDESKLGFSLSSDHGEYQLVHRKLQAYVVAHYLGTEEKKALGDLTPFNMSNMEYATAAYSEDLPGHEALMDRAAKGVERHAIASTAAAASGTQTEVPETALLDLYTGVPMDAFKSLLKGDAPGLALLNDAHTKASNPMLAYQTTVGTMPSEIPGLFKQEAKELKEFKGAANDLAGRHREHEARAKALILAASLDSAEKALARAPAALRATFGGAHPEQALLGWMTLVAQYLMASLLDQTTYRYVERRQTNGHTVFRTGYSSTKNLLPYLSKVPLHLSQAALPLSVRPSLATGDTEKLDRWKNLFDILLANCVEGKGDLMARAGVKPVTGTVLDNRNQPIAVGPAVLPGDAAAWLNSVLFTDKSSNVISGRALAVEEPVDRETKTGHDGEKAIPLEDRATKYKIRFGNAVPSNASVILMAEWRRAKARRAESIAKGITKADEIKSGGLDAPLIGDLESPPIPSGSPTTTDSAAAASTNEIEPHESKPDDDFFDLIPLPYWSASSIPSESPADIDSTTVMEADEAKPGEFDAPPIDDFGSPLILPDTDSTAATETNEATSGEFDAPPIDDLELPPIP